MMICGVSDLTYNGICNEDMEKAVAVEIELKECGHSVVRGDDELSVSVGAGDVHAVSQTYWRNPPPVWTAVHPAQCNRLLQWLWTNKTSQKRKGCHCACCIGSEDVTCLSVPIQEETGHDVSGHDCWWLAGGYGKHKRQRSKWLTVKVL